MTSKFIIIMFALLAILAMSCSDDPVSPKAYDNLPYLSEAETMALYYSGELFPPEDLVRKYSRELDAIRRTWGDSIPEVFTRFEVPWLVSGFRVRVDDTTWSSINDSINRPWDSLCNYYNLTYRGMDLLTSKWFFLRSINRMNSLLLAKMFIGFPGISHIETSPPYYPYPYHHARFEDGRTIKYFYRTECQMDIYDTYYYFAVTGPAVKFIDRHATCLEVLDSLSHVWPFDSLVDYESKYVDSVEANKPAWVDTARFHFYDIEDGDAFWWSRPE